MKTASHPAPHRRPRSLKALHALLSSALLPSLLLAQAPPRVLDTLTVYGESENDSIIQNPFPEAVEDQRIFAGKRATVIDLDALPKVQANNYRQALALTPGLLFSEETTPLVSLGFRGIGTPDRSQFLQVLKDGIPIHSDPFGYPEAYYTPPLDVVDRLEFVRGGAALMFGAQPAGALNYVTHMPVTDRPFTFRTQNVFGSDDFYSNYTSFSGTQGSTGYYGHFNHRQSNLFSDSNSRYRLDGGLLKLVESFNDRTRLVLSLDLYGEKHGEPGGLTLANFRSNPNQTTRPNDKFDLTRYAVSADLQHNLQPGTDLSVKMWFAHLTRQSWRQQGGGFGLLPSGPKANTNVIQDQRFYSLGLEPRLRHEWEGLGGQHTLAAGFQLYGLRSPRSDREGQSATALEGLLDGSQFFDSEDAKRRVFYGSVFAENKFTWGDLSLTPGFRFEGIRQAVDSRKWLADPAKRRIQETSVTKIDYQPLFGLGLAYELPRQQQLFLNVSQSYRPTLFSQSIVAGPGMSATNADPNIGWSYEAGVRGRPFKWLTYDTSLFVIDLDNRFGVANNTLTSVGRSINYGWDLSTQVDLIGVLAARTGKDLNASCGNLNLYGSLTLLEAGLYGGPSDGGTPSFAPKYLLRTGAIYGFRKTKVSFLGTLMGRHNAQDSGNSQFDIPSYVTWDLTAEFPIHKNVSLMAGINNVFDRQYYSRVTAVGIDPSYGRNFYAGFAFQF
jgi:Fe(3+) dicitrate transport protein